MPSGTTTGAPVRAARLLRLTRTWRPGQEVVLDLPMPARLVRSHPSDDPYPAADRTDPPASSTTTQVPLVPYHLWANREPGAMRVWLRHT